MCMPKHMMLQWSKWKNEFKKMITDFKKIGYRGIIPFVNVGKEEMLKFLWYEVSITVYGLDSKSKKNTKIATI